MIFCTFFSYVFGINICMSNVNNGIDQIIVEKKYEKEMNMNLLLYDGRMK